MFKYFLFFLLFVFLLFSPELAFASNDLPIQFSEIAFKEDSDFIEIEVVDAIEGFTVYEGGVKIFETSEEFSDGDVIVLHEEVGVDVFIDDVFHFYGIGGLTGTDNILTLRNAGNEIIDVAIWSNSNGSFTSSKTVLSEVLALHLWSCARSVDFSGDDFAWIDSDDVKKGESISRMDGLDCEEYQKTSLSPGVVGAVSPKNYHIAINGDIAGDVGEKMIFTASGSFPENYDLSWYVDDVFVDEAEIFEYGFTNAGLHQIRVVVFDNEQEVARDVYDVSIKRVDFDHSYRISEVLPNPVGSDEEGEFIEVEYFGDGVADLYGYTVRDSRNSYVFGKEDVFFDGFLFVSRERSGIALNNDSDSLELVDPSGDLVASLAYTGSREGMSFSWIDNGYFWSEKITKGKKNILEIVAIGGNEKIDDVEVPENVSHYLEVANVYISELLPNPEGLDSNGEWIELYNAENFDVDLSGWSLDDLEGGSKPFDLDGVVLGAHSYLVLHREQTGLAFNNSNDGARLLNSKNVVISEIFYENTIEGASFSRNGLNVFEWTSHLTPGADNLFSPILSEKKLSSVSKKKSVSSKKSVAYKRVSLTDAMKLEKGELVEVLGVVSIVPGVFSKNIFYVQDGEFGVQVYISKGVIPDLHIGDLVLLRGKVSVAGGEKRLLVSGDDIETEKRNVEVRYQHFSTSDANDQALGTHMEIRGFLVKKEGSVLFIDDGSGVVKVFLSRGSEIRAKDFVVGQEYLFEGVLRLKDGAVILYASSFDSLVDDLSADQHSGILYDAQPENAWRGYFGYVLFLIPLALLALFVFSWRYFSNKKTLN